MATSCRKWLVDFNAGKTQLVSLDRSKNNAAVNEKMDETGVLIHSMNFLSPQVALYLYKSTIRPCMGCCCHVWVGAPTCYLELLDKLQKRICRTVAPSLAASLEPLAHRRNVVSLSLFYRYYFGR